jgi:Arc/MetJ family transcription regulator
MCITIHIRRLNMRTNIVLDDNLVTEAFKYAKDIHTKKELVEIALQEFVKNRKLKDIRDLRGKIEFSEGYDYKSMRS